MHTSISRLQFFSFASTDPKIPGAKGRHLPFLPPCFLGENTGRDLEPQKLCFHLLKAWGAGRSPPWLSRPPLSAPASPIPSSLSRDEGQRSQVLGKQTKSGLNFPKSELTIFLFYRNDKEGGNPTRNPGAFRWLFHLHTPVFPASSRPHPMSGIQE